MKKAIVCALAALALVAAAQPLEERAKALLERKRETTAAAPGASEHQTGLGIDVYVKNFAGEGFVKSQAGQFVNSESWRPLSTR